MWVDVIRLRRDGARLPQAQLRDATPLRACLTVDTMTTGGPLAGDADVAYAQVARLWQPGRTTQAPRVLDNLEFAQVRRVGGDALLVIGVENHDGAAAPQAWWCRIVMDAGAEPSVALRDGSPVHAMAGMEPLPLPF